MHRRFIALGVIVFALAQPARAADAPMFRGNAQHSGVYAAPWPREARPA